MNESEGLLYPIPEVIIEHTPVSTDKNPRPFIHVKVLRVKKKCVPKSINDHGLILGIAISLIIVLMRILVTSISP